MRKKILTALAAIILTFTFVLSSVACGKEQSSGGSQSESTGSSVGGNVETTTKIDDTNIDFAKNGKTEYKIIVTEERTNVINYVVDDMVNFVEQATGATLTVQTETENFSENDKIISIGRTTAFEASGIVADYNELGRDGFVIKRKGNAVFICGGRDFGTAFGAYEFLTHEIAFEPYAQDEIYFEKSNNVKIKDFDLKSIPDIASRTADGRFQFEPATGFRLRLLTDYSFMPASFNNGSQDEWIPAPDHTLRQILQYSEYGAAHSDWFLGQDSTGVQICLTDPELIEAFIHETEECIEQKPNGRYISITQQDSAAWCMCDNCKTERSNYYFGGYFVRFVNKVIQGFTYEKDGKTIEVEGVRAWTERNYPGRDFIYTTFAYGDTRKAPVDANGNLLNEDCRPDKDLYIRFASCACQYHELDDPNCSLNREAYDYLSEWMKIHDKFQIWDYAADFYNYMLFFNDFGTTNHTLQLYKDIGVGHIFREYASGNNVYPFAKLRLYLFAKASWDVNVDTNALMNSFIDNYYKAAAPYIKEYLNLMFNHFAIMDEKTGHAFHSQNVTSYSVEQWPRTLIEKSLEIFDKALAAANTIEDKEVAETVRLRVIEEKVCVQFNKLRYYSGYGYNSDKLSDFVAEFKENVNAVNALGWREFGLLSDFLKSYE